MSAAEIAAMRAAATVIEATRAGFASNDSGILAEVGADAERLAEWQHYPAGDVYDGCSHAQYFYHSHPPTQRGPREHGHFHTFLRAEGMPFGVTPLVLPEAAIADAPPSPPQAAPLKRGHRDEVSHLVAIALSVRGEPIRLFTTNRWVTGETWYCADDVIRMLDCFTLEAADGPVPVNRWVGAIMRLFRPQIVYLLRLRDEAVMSWRRRRRTNVFEDVRLEVTSSFDIDLDSQFALLDRLRSDPDPGISPGAARLLQTAEGWGEGHAS
ncbi:MAG: hypothetical protein JO081_19775 [Alphaproteobacteria bacterium]|nr:hypothetical protein [Alphaproteobacteria bacterium]